MYQKCTKLFVVLSHLKDLLLFQMQAMYSIMCFLVCIGVFIRGFSLWDAAPFIIHLSKFLAREGIKKGAVYYSHNF